MKNILIGIILIALSSVLESQNHHSFPQTNGIWHSIGSNNFCEDLYSYQYMLDGDTVINNENWSKIYSFKRKLDLRSDWQYFAAIR